MAAGTAIVTGGSRGVGKTITRVLSELGYVVHICARTESELARTAREIPRVIPRRLDVMDCEATRRWLEEIIAQASSVDVLVNNVGIMAAVGPLWTVSMEEWETVIRYNLITMARICHQVIPVMIRQQRGCIINLAGGGSAYPRSSFSAYGCSKAAVLRLSDTLAEELRPFHVRVNAITPGMFKSDIWRHALKAGERPAHEEWVGPERLIRLVRYVVTSPSLTGKFLHVDDPYDQIDAQVLASELYTLRRISPSGHSVIPVQHDQSVNIVATSGPAASQGT